MRCATLTLEWGADVHLHPLDDLLMETDNISVDMIHYISPVYEGRYLEFINIRGDIANARSILESSKDAIDFDIAENGDTGVVYLQCRATGLVDDLLRIVRERDIVIDWPMRYTDTADGHGLQFTLVGTDQALHRAISDVPSSIELELERIGEYDPNRVHSPNILSDKQEQLLELAIQEGYYEVPRKTAHKELASKLNLTAATVGERLQRIEIKLANAYH